MSWRENKVRLGCLSCKPLFWWVSSRVTPDNPTYDLDLARDTPVLYVIAHNSFIDAMVLHKVCERSGLPMPDLSADRLASSRGGARRAACLALTKPRIVPGQRLSYQEPKLAALLQTLMVNRKRDIKVVPVSIFWGRNPGKGEEGIFKLLFSDEANASKLQKLFIVLAHGRGNIVKFGKAISLQELLGNVTPSAKTTAAAKEKSARAERKAILLQRMLRIYFQRERNMVLGEKLYDRDQIVRKVVKSAPVCDLIKDIAKHSRAAFKLEVQARKYAREIAADMSYSVVQAFSIILGKLWNRLYDGVEVRNLGPVKELANKKYEIVYVSNHRSHLDYLLVNYSLYANDLPTPHTAAGINLNFFPIGVVLRKGGAFFIRRTFRGNRLYTTVFNEYLHHLLTNGYPVQFFPEGGRSRTGRLREPKSGFFAMILNSFMRDSARPIALVPVHINYDKVAEVASYLKELNGDKKRKENFFQLFQSLKILKKYWGKAYLNFGEPLVLSDMLTETHPAWREEAAAFDRKPPWFNEFVEQLTRQMMTRINGAAVVTPVALLSFALLSSPHKALPEDDLIELGEGLLALLGRFSLGGRVILPAGTMADHLKSAEKLGCFKRFAHIGGDIIHLGELDAILMGYYRNTISHLMAMPALVARLFNHTRSIGYHELKGALIDIYPYLQTELFLPWTGEEIPQMADALLDAMAAMGMLSTNGGRQGVYTLAEPPSPGHELMSHLCQAVGVNFDSFAITTLLVAQPGNTRQIDLAAFTKDMQKIAQRLTILNGLSAPISAESDLFASHIKLLEHLGYLTITGNTIAPSATLPEFAERLKMILKPDDARHFLIRTRSPKEQQPEGAAAPANTSEPRTAAAALMRQGASRARNRLVPPGKIEQLIALKEREALTGPLTAEKGNAPPPDA